MNRKLIISELAQGKDRDVVSLAQWFLKSWSADRRRSAELKSPVREIIFEKKRSAYKK